MSNRQKTPVARRRCERCGRRNHRLQAQTFTGPNQEEQQEAVTAALCQTCTRNVLSHLGINDAAEADAVMLPPVPEPSQRKAKGKPAARN